MKRVVVTGLGCMTSLGENVEEFFLNIKNGRHGFSHIEEFDTSDIRTKVSGSIKGFDPTKYGIEKKEARRMDRYTQLGMAAAYFAMKDCGTDFSDLDPYDVGIIVGSGVGGMKTMEIEITKFATKGAGKVSPFFVPMMISNILSGYISIKYKLQGENYCPVTACASSAHAIGQAFRLIRDGSQIAVVTGGAEAAITKSSIAGFENMMALSASDNPDRCSIPFDKERDGFVMGEGAAIIVLEELEHAKSRGAKIYGEIIGYGATADAYHITSQLPDGGGSAKAMEKAVKDGGIEKEQVEYINAHGTSTEINDKCETIAIKRLFGEHAHKLMVSSTKSMTGHLLGGAGAVEALITILALRDGIVPPTAGYKVPDEECDLDYVTTGARGLPIKYALSNSLGFGGHNVSLLFKKYE